MRETALVVVVALLVPGCLGFLGEDEGIFEGLPEPDAVTAYALPRLVQDHDHALPDEHVGAIGFTELAFAPARETYPAGEVYLEMAVKGGFAYLTFGPRDGVLLPGAEAGVILYDVSDPAAPAEIGRWLGQAPSDVEVSDDNEFLFVSTQRNGYPYPYVLNPLAPIGNLPRGTYVIDLSDKSAPSVASFFPLPANGPHTITYFRMPDGRELVFHQTYDLIFTTYPDNLGQNSASQKVVIAEFVREPQPHLVPLSTYQILEPDPEGKNFLPHDTSAHVDPATGAVILDVAYWDKGLVMVDITDPAAPMELARFDDTAPSNYTKTHSARVFPGTIGGRVVAVLEPEIASGNDDGQYTFVDVTDPLAPHKLGVWSLPGAHIIDQPFVFSPHNYDLVCGGNGQPVAGPGAYETECEDPLVVLSHFHGGLWALDARDPTSPQAVAFYFPSVEREDIPAGFPFTGFFTSFVVDGVVYAPESWTGLYTLRLGGGE